MKKEHLDKLHNIAARLDSVSDTLNSKIKALYTVGMSQFADSLNYIKSDIDLLQRNAIELSRDMVLDAVQVADQSSKNVLEAALAGIQLEKNQSGPKTIRLKRPGCQREIT